MCEMFSILDPFTLQKFDLSLYYSYKTKPT